MKFNLHYSIYSVSYLEKSRKTLVAIINDSTGEIFVGTARKHPDDELNLQLGIDLALNRALQKATLTALKDEEVEIIARDTDR